MALLGLSLGLAAPDAPAQTPDGRRSGYHDMGKSLQAMQDDDTANPGMLWVQEGAQLWTQRTGAAGKACADCHAGATAMAGVAARYPAFDAKLGRPLDLEQRISQCRSEHQQAAPVAADDRAALALVAYVAYQSRGQPIAPPDDQRLRPFVEAGEALFKGRQGQLNLACSQCHDDNPGRKLGGATIPQAHPTGYPIYRLEWQSLGSLKRRLRNCLVGMRAEPYAPEAPEYVALELFLMRRAAGMKLEAPAVRP
ncbi:MAG TPA: sulfur oxidation c-type cytochrome SoxA [Vineibacter sp.]|nr:sulfur oxidation c-type cytochrome SoxA [Vineibacter sp.]